jgi:integrase
MRATRTRKRAPRRRGHLRQRGNSWVVTYRADGRQVWKSFKSREEADLFLADVQTRHAKNDLRAPARVTFREAAYAWLDLCEHERGLAASTIRDRRSAVNRWLIPPFGDRRLDHVTAEAVTRWRREQMRTMVERPDGTKRPAMGRRNAEKLTALLFSIFEHGRAEYALAANPIGRVERLRVKYDPGRFDTYSPEEVHALRRAAVSDQDAAIFAVAAFAGLRRGEVLALRWRDVDFAAETLRVEQAVSAVGQEMKSTKSGRMRSVPMVPDVATALDRLSRRDTFTGPDDLVFVGEDGGPLDGSALRRRFVAAAKRTGLRTIRFHDLRHSFATVAVNATHSGRELQEWMGHADYRTTSRYLHYKSRGDEAQRLGAAFAAVSPAAALQLESDRRRLPRAAPIA